MNTNKILQIKCFSEAKCPYRYKNVHTVHINTNGADNNGADKNKVKASFLHFRVRHVFVQSTQSLHKHTLNPSIMTGDSYLQKP